MSMLLGQSTVAHILGGQGGAGRQVAGRRDDLAGRVLGTAQPHPLAEEVGNDARQQRGHQESNQNSSQARKSPPPERIANAIKSAYRYRQTVGQPHSARLLDIQYRMRLKSFGRMVPNQFHRIQNRLTHPAVHHHVTDRQYATGEGCHDQNTRDLHHSHPGPYRGYQLHVAAAHTSKHKQEIENSSAEQHSQQAALESRPAREPGANHQPDQ